MLSIVSVTLKNVASNGYTMLLQFYLSKAYLCHNTTLDVSLNVELGSFFTLTFVLVLILSTKVSVFMKDIIFLLTKTTFKVVFNE